MLHLRNCIMFIFLPVMFFAQQKDSVSNYNLYLNTFNDSWGGGTTKIRDDYRSFGTSLAFEVPGSFCITTQLSGLTDKYAAIPVNQKRLDEFYLTGKFIIKRNFFNYLNIFGIAGLYDLNNYGGEYIQNSTHQLFGVSEVKLPYSDFRHTFYQLGLNFNTNQISLKSYGNTLFCLQPELETYILPGYYASIKPSIPLKLVSEKGPSFSLIFAYQHASLLTTHPLLNTIINMETGPVIEYRLKAGIFSISRTLYTGNNYSYGSYGLNILLAHKKVAYKAADVSVEAGNLNDGNGYYCKYLWNKTGLVPDYLNYVLYNQFGTYLKKRNPDYPKTYGHYQQVSAGIELKSLKDQNWFPLVPYIGIQLGLKRELVYSGSEHLNTITAYSPFAFGEAGLKIKPPGKLFYENTRWGLSLHYKYLYSFWRSNKAFSNVYKLPESLGYLGAGIFIMLDM